MRTFRSTDDDPDHPEALRSSVRRRRRTTQPFEAPASTRRWPEHVHPLEVKHLLDEGRFVDLLARLREAAAHAPGDLELQRSIRHLERALARRVARLRRAG